MADDTSAASDLPEMEQLRTAVIRCWVQHFPTLSAPALALHPSKGRQLCDHVRDVIGRRDITDDTILEILRRCGA